MRDISINQKQFDNLINCWSNPNPRDAFYMKVFGRTYTDQKAHERKMYASRRKMSKKKVLNKTERLTYCKRTTH